MCGIVGFLDPFGRFSEGGAAIVGRMAAAVGHRGPDSAGIWEDKNAGVYLGHRRLAVIDLTNGGHQPMKSETSRYCLVFNGEIYNFLELRRILLSVGHRFRGNSDTEVMLAAFEQWGVEAALTRFVGMFAFALWDGSERILHLARDRMGEKPLYYGWVEGALLFASELKALRAHKAWRGEIDRDALALYMRHNCVPAPYSIYRGIYKMPAACLLSLRAGGRLDGFSPHPRGGTLAPLPYWSARQAAEAGAAAPLTCSDSEAVQQLDTLLRGAIAQKMVADVPLGAFLSGGIDSSVVVALMQAQSPRPVKTFTIGFKEEGYDEARHAAAVARHLGTEHTELYVTPQEAMDVIYRLPALFDEPFSDSSQIPTFLLSQLARRHVTVALSGDGGDELFGGYNRYFWSRDIWRRLGWAPRWMRTTAAGALRAVSPQVWNRAFDTLGRALPQRLRLRLPGDKLHKLADVLGVPHAEAMYLGLVSHWTSRDAVVRDGRELATALTDRALWATLPDFIQRMMYLDAITYLSDDILVKIDRASMGVSLEARVPLVDHNVAEFAWRVPLSMKIRNGQGKWLLRQVLYRYVPRPLVDRPKMGFGVPIDHWLRGPLRAWADELLSVSRLEGDGFFASGVIRHKWAEHLAGGRNWAGHLWDVLMFQIWLDEQRDGLQAMPAAAAWAR